MADPRRIELDELLIRPGTYFNVQTEVLVVVDDSPDLDTDVFNMEQYEGAEWVVVSDDLPLDEPRRDEMFETFQTHLRPGAAEGEEEEELADTSDPLELDDQEAGRE